MLRILDRYIFREIALTWLAVTAVLLFILLTNQFARVLGEVAKDSLPKDAIFQIIGLTAVQYMTVLVPIGLFLSIMLALGRFYRDSELPAMMACRVGPSDIYRPLSWLMLPLVIGVGWLAMDTAPKALSEIERISLEARRQADLASIEPGKFAVDNSQGAVIYAENVIGPGVIENVFMERRLEQGSVEVIVARRGEQRDSDDPNTRYFVLFDGRRYEGVPGTSKFRVMEFAEHGIPYQLPGVEDGAPEPRAMRTLDLMMSSIPAEIAEWHFRIGVPMATLILAILAGPRSRSQPRQGRYGKLAVGLLVFIIYFNLMSAGKAWLEQGSVSPMVGIWWVHALMLSIALILLSLQNGLHRRLFAARRRA
ncbi:MAG: LPS export ABC transporter permease LptF [Woeseiaceae bacterium]